MDSFPLHYFCSFFFNIFITFLLKTGVKDNLGGYFLVKKKKIKESINKKIFYGYGDYFIRLIFFLKKKKIKIKEIPTIFKKRKYGLSKSRFIKLFFSYLFEVFKIRIKNLR